MADRVRERDVRISGLRIHIREVGEGRPLLLLNGLGAPTAWWSTLEGHLDGVRLIEVDAPGVGGSQTPWVPARVEYLGWLAARALDHVKVERADVLGYSLGGMIAQHLAARSPQRVRRLVLCSTGCGFGGVAAGLTKLLNVATPLRYLSKDLYDRTIPDLVGGRARNDPEFLERHSERRFAQPPNKRGYMLQVTALGAWSSLPVLSKITAPTLVVTGDDDPLMPMPNAYILARRIANARLHVAAGEGHLLLMDERSGAFEPIRAFLGAETLDDEPAWRDATVVDDAVLAAAMPPSNGAGRALGAAGAAWRRAWSPPTRSVGQSG
jgi:pimeloyl-ACP methyl ester carboxylesterase